MGDTMVGIWGWSIADKIWYKVGANAIGELLIDTDALETLIAALIPPDLEDITFKVEEQVPIVGFATEATLGDVLLAVDGLEGALGQCYGWDGAAWEKLLVEDATNFNLRVKLYDGAQGIVAKLTDAAVGAGVYGLVTAACIQARWINTAAPIYLVCSTAADNLANQLGLVVNSQLLGFDGTYWDRLRTYGTGILKVGVAPIGSTLVRKTAPGLVKAGACTLYQMCVNPSAANAVLEITDAIAALGAIAFDTFYTTRETHHFVFSPPLEFTTGIWLETLTGITSVMLCYV